jgi:hypothetical protein
MNGRDSADHPELEDRPIDSPKRPEVQNESISKQIIDCRESVAAAWRDTMICYGWRYDFEA